MNTHYGYGVWVYGGPMALTGERAVRRVALPAASALCWALLTIAVALAPMLTCPTAPAAAAGSAITDLGVVAASLRVTQAPPLITAAVDTGDHHGCQLLPVINAVTATGPGALQGWALAITVMAFGIFVAWASRHTARRGPPRGRPRWLSTSGRECLLRLCVMRR